jgi:hypothetical protein
MSLEEKGLYERSFFIFEQQVFNPDKMVANLFQTVMFRVNDLFDETLFIKYKSWIHLRKKETLLAERQTKDAIFGDVLVLQR